MHMFAYFHKLYPKVLLSMHAGELRPALVPLEDMYEPGEIREAVELAGASRIGHGLDVLYEKNPKKLLAEMAENHVLVEVAGGHYMLPVYIAAGVPVSIATDDEGVGRIDLLYRFTFDTQTYHLDYYELKKMVRDSLEHAFIGGADLWSAPEGFDTKVAACNDQPFTGTASGTCRAFLAASPRATLEWKEEGAFAAFEGRF
jgi:adenosine deaminase